MTLLATFDHLWESKWNPIRNYQTVSEEEFSEVRYPLAVRLGKVGATPCLLQWRSYRGCG
jgi:hypothetical protein